MISEYLISKAETIGDPLLLQKLQEKQENEKAIEEVIEEQEESEVQSKYEKTISENSMIGIRELPDQIGSSEVRNTLHPYNSYTQNPYEDEKHFDISDSRMVDHSRNNSFINESRQMSVIRDNEYNSSTKNLNYHNSVRSTDFLDPNYLQRRRKSVNDRSRSTINKNDSTSTIQVPP